MGLIILGLHWDYVGVVLGLYWDNGEENGNYYSILGDLLLGSKYQEPIWRLPEGSGKRQGSGFTVQGSKSACGCGANFEIGG